MQKYQSIFGADGLITGTQYIAEIMIQRNSNYNHVKLPDRFWTDFSYQSWKKEFLRQKRRADALVNAGYEVAAILEALKQKKFSRCYSLFNKQLEMAIHEENRKLQLRKETQSKEEKQVEVTQETVIPLPQVSGKKTNIGKLRD